MKYLVLVAALALLSLTPGVSAQSASASYDPSTGEIELTLQPNVGVAGFESAEGLLVPTSLSDALVAAQATESVIAFFSATGLPSGTFNLGPIVTVGTPVGDLGFSFTPVGGETTVAPIAVIPEPATLVLIGLGGLALAGRRKHA